MYDVSSNPVTRWNQRSGFTPSNSTSVDVFTGSIPDELRRSMGNTYVTVEALRLEFRVVGR